MKKIQPKFTVIEGDENGMITFLRQTIEEIQAGRISAVAVIGLMPDGGYAGGWSGSFEEDVFHSLGAMEDLKMDYVLKYKGII